ncbi:V-type ATP synthase subunit A [archaeon]|nr:V-type ATP synthase subunit A [archaeon]
MKNKNGNIIFISGAIIKAEGLSSSINDLCFIGPNKLLGEIVKIEDKIITIQVYESTKMLKINDTVTTTGESITAELGPGLLGSIYDGLQRPLTSMDNFLKNGTTYDKLDKNKKWDVKVTKKGTVKKGELIATIKETKTITHKIFAKNDGIINIKEGKYTIKETIGTLTTKNKKENITLITKWPVKEKIPYKKYIAPDKLLVTGQRVLDTMYPLALGGAGAMPGGFGTGKTILGHQLAKWSSVDIVIFVGVGERGNEMADILLEFPQLEDLKTKEKLLTRSVLIANTSNMPVAARITSIHFGALVGEYYRNMGYNVLLIADSTSRWAEALRELSGMQEEMPGEEGYPVYLASQTGIFYERAGVVETESGLTGSLSIIGAVSPPGGDFTEPVTDATKRVVDCFWTLNANLAYHRHYPAVDWNESYSNYDIKGLESIKNYRIKMMQTLQKEKELERIARIVGYDALPKKDKFMLLVAKLFRETFLQQNAFHEIDKYCNPEKQKEMIQTFSTLLDTGLEKIEKNPHFEFNKDLIENIARMKFEDKNNLEYLRNEIINA